MHSDECQNWTGSTFCKSKAGQGPPKLVLVHFWYGGSAFFPAKSTFGNNTEAGPAAVQYFVAKTGPWSCSRSTFCATGYNYMGHYS